MSRPNIEIDDARLETVVHRSDIRTKTEAVDDSLLTLAETPMSIQETLAMHGAIPDFVVPLDQHSAC